MQQPDIEQTKQKHNQKYADLNAEPIFVDDWTESEITELHGFVSTNTHIQTISSRMRRTVQDIESQLAKDGLKFEQIKEPEKESVDKIAFCNIKNKESLKALQKICDEKEAELIKLQNRVLEISQLGNNIKSLLDILNKTAISTKQFLDVTHETQYEIKNSLALIHRDLLGLETNQNKLAGKFVEISTDIKLVIAHQSDILEKILTTFEDAKNLNKQRLDHLKEKV